MLPHTPYILPEVGTVGPQAAHLMYLEQWFPTFLVLWPFDTVLCVAVTLPTVKLFPLLLYSCNFATVVNPNVNICPF